MKGCRLGTDGLIGLSVRAEESRDGGADLVVGRRHHRRVATAHPSEIRLREFRWQRGTEVRLADTELLRESAKGRDALTLRKSEDRRKTLLEGGLVPEFIEEDRDKGAVNNSASSLF